MDQESFRRLLQTSRPSGSDSTRNPSTSRGSLFAPGSKTKSKTIDSAQPAFKPRKVNKSADVKYRDRAAERRVGEGNDYAQVEAVLQDFEKRNADADDKTVVEAQRQYLGGDGEHSILVKGLDVALLEQNKARAALSTEDDDSLEQAFLEVASESTVPKKRTREDLIRELKEKRAQKGDMESDVKVPKTVEEEARLLEEAKKKGKFKPIGFKPVGSADDSEKNKKATVGGKVGEKKKKRRKIKADGSTKDVNGGIVVNKKVAKEVSPPPVVAAIQPTHSAHVAVEPEPEPERLPDDFDIFAGAGEYEGFGLDGDDDDDDEEEKSRTERQQSNVLEDGEEPSPAGGPGRWIQADEPEHLSPGTEALPPILESRSPPPGHLDGKEEDKEIEQPSRLVPLASSALPSIKDFLAMEKAAGAQGKRRKRKEKKKGAKDDDEDSKKRAAEAKADRDYKRLKTYTDKKAASSSTK